MKVDRHSLLAHALRRSVPLKFWPLDPPRPLSQRSQVYARTKHVFSSGHGFKSIFRSKQDKATDGAIIVEARLPSPAILILGKPIPITLIIKRDSGYVGTVIIQSVEIVLGITTAIHIQGSVSNDQARSSILCQKNLNLNLPPEQEELFVFPADINGSREIPLPQGFLPSFRSCNISRTYSLILRIGLRDESAKKPEQVQLVLGVQVFSGLTRRMEPPTIETREERSGRDINDTNSDAEPAESSQLPSYKDSMANPLIMENPRH